MNDAMSNIKKEKSREELLKLYDTLTAAGLKELRVNKGNITSAIYVVLTGKSLARIPMGLDKEEEATLVKDLLKTGRALAVIWVFKGWILDHDKHTPISLPLKHHTRLEETFYSMIESVEVRMSKSWKIKRDDRGKMIFPLRDPEVFPDNSAFMSSFTGDYFRSKQKTNMKN